MVCSVLFQHKHVNNDYNSNFIAPISSLSLYKSKDTPVSGQSLEPAQVTVSSSARGSLSPDATPPTTASPYHGTLLEAKVDGVHAPEHPGRGTPPTPGQPKQSSGVPTTSGQTTGSPITSDPSDRTSVVDSSPATPLSSGHMPAISVIPAPSGQSPAISVIPAPSGQSPAISVTPAPSGQSPAISVIPAPSGQSPLIEITSDTSGQSPVISTSSGTPEQPLGCSVSSSSSSASPLTPPRPGSVTQPTPTATGRDSPSVVRGLFADEDLGSASDEVSDTPTVEIRPRRISKLKRKPFLASPDPTPPPTTAAPQVKLEEVQSIETVLSPESNQTALSVQEAKEKMKHLILPAMWEKEMKALFDVPFATKLDAIAALNATAA